MVLAVWIASGQIFACGPYFSNTLLDRGDAALMFAPQAVFRKELERMKLVPSAHRAIPPTNGYTQQTFDAELADLAAALDKEQVVTRERDAVVSRHKIERDRIASPVHGETLRPTNSNRLNASAPQITPGLPGEFADYFRGSIAWHQDKMSDARAAWTSLLARPAAARPFKSTWAAFMLGRSWEEEDRGQAISHFQNVRALAKAGFADSLGLAAASLGYEARLHWREKRYAAAIDLYLEQAASGDPIAEISLRVVAYLALQTGAPALRPLAAHPRAQRVMTAYVISGGTHGAFLDVDSAAKEPIARLLSQVKFLTPPSNGWHTLKEPVEVWLEAVEAAKIKDVESAEQLALAAYQSGQMEMAQRWIHQARATPVTEWLRAKLLLRDGKVDEATALLAKVSRHFPVQPGATNLLANAGLENSLFIDSGESKNLSLAEQMQGELGVIHLARGQYTEALNALLHSTYWSDAAYVAERVLTADELKTYVDRHWPATPSRKVADSEISRTDEPVQSEIDPAWSIRHLLARRLARAKRWTEARDYFPADWKESFDKFHQAMKISADKTLANAPRANALFQAAKIARKDGMDLFGTELEPDWHLYGGSFEEGVTVESRAKNRAGARYMVATGDEQRRAELHEPEVAERFHYRFTAAIMAWEAAKLLPNNSEQTARVLCTGGSWLKHQDIKTADLFYKALVRRCRKTAIGAEADRLRWFPALDENGNLKPKESPPETSIQ